MSGSLSKHVKQLKFHNGNVSMESVSKVVIWKHYKHMGMPFVWCWKGSHDIACMMSLCHGKSEE